MLYKFRIFTFFILLYATQAFSQASLVQNGSFENHAQTACLYCDLNYGKYPTYVYSWDNLGSGAVLFDTRYTFPESRDRMSQGIVIPKHGNAMVGLDYFPACGGKDGCMDYLCAKTTETLQVGHLYEISFWLYIQSGEHQDPNWTKRIGMAILPQKVKNEYRLQVPSLSIDTAIYDQWYLVKWKVRPLCNSKYLLIGTFRTDDWPGSRSYYTSFYYIDQVCVRQLPDPEGGVLPDSSVYFCSQYDPQKNPKLKPDMDRLQLYFESGSAELPPAALTALDSLAVLASRYPYLVFEVSGHTDSIGTENQLLSQHRVQAVAKYLEEHHSIASPRIVPCSFGSARPVASNQTAAGRALNRRVEVAVCDMNLPQAYYRYALASESISEKFKFLHKWQKLIPPLEHHVLMLDPRFEGIRTDKRWALLKKQMSEAYQHQKYPRQAFLIDSLFIDAELTNGMLTYTLNYLSGYSPAIDTVFFDELPVYSPAVVLNKGKERFAKGFKPVLEEVGWPSKSVFGETVQNSAFFLLYGAEDPAVLERWLPTLKASCEAGETPWVMYAKIFDRCQVLNKKPQRYGFEVEKTLEIITVKPCEGNREEVNRLRSRLNLQLVPEEHVFTSTLKEPTRN